MTFKTLPLVSVVIPTYNREKLIARSVYSVLQQSYSNIEIIIVDDCSNDKTQDAISAINDKRIKFIKLEHNSGPSVARNKGCSLATGEYITFLDSDDAYCPDKIEIQVQEFIKDDTIGMVFCKYACVEEKTGNILLEVPEANRVEAINNGIDLKEEFLRKNLAGTPTIMIKKEVLDQTGGFNEACRTLEDWVFALKIVHNTKVKFIDKSLINVYPSKDGINQIKDMRLVNTCFYILRTYWNMYDDKSLFSYLISLIFNALCTLSEYEQATKICELNDIIDVANQPNFSKIANLLYSCLISSSSNISYWQGVADERTEFINHWQNVADERLELINYWQGVADERLELINYWQGVADERLQIINDLQKAIAVKQNEFTRQIAFEKFKKSMLSKICQTCFFEELSIKIGSYFCIYGVGEVGRCFVSLCKRYEIDIPFTIDRKPKIVLNIPSYAVEEIPNDKTPIIITAYDPSRQIVKCLKKFTNAKIEYLEDL